MCNFGPATKKDENKCFIETKQKKKEIWKNTIPIIEVSIQLQIDFQLLTISDLPFDISQLLNYFTSLLSNTSQHLQYCTV